MDDGLATVRSIMPEAIFLPLPENLGFAGGANAGIALASGKWIATLNNDVQVEPGWLAVMRKAAADASSSCGMLQPCILSSGGRGRVDTTGVVMLRGGGIEDRDRGKIPRDSSPAGEVFCVSAGAAWYRRDMLDAVAPRGDYFDPDYFMYYEDVDLGWRCRLAGWSAAYVPAARVLHDLHGSSDLQPNGFVKRQCTRNRIRTIIGNGSVRYIAGAVPRIAKDIGWLLVAERHRAVSEIGRAIRTGFRARRALPNASRRARGRVESTWFAAP
jgi:GT2 family glycosyltransferase